MSETPKSDEASGTLRAQPVGAWPASLNDGSEMGRLILEKDWSRTPLGPIESWPQTLRTAVGMCLATRFPMFIYWGPQRVQLYNDAGIPIMGAKHPHGALGPVAEVFPELWPFLAPMFDGIERTGLATRSENQPLPIARNGFVEEAYFTWSYSPVRDDSGAIVGIYTPAMETTGQVLGQRRLRTLQSISNRSAGAASSEEACRAALAALAENPADLPFALLYLTDAGGTRASLLGACGLEPQHSGVPEQVDLRAESSANRAAWLLGSAASSHQVTVVDDVGEWFEALPAPTGMGTPRSALVLPLSYAQGDRPLGFLVVGLSPLLTLAGEYRSFLELAAGAVTTAASSARAQQEVRERAEKLAALDRAKTAFFSNVSHEFRTPLTLMLGPVEDALADASEPLGPQQRERLSLIQRSATRLLKLVNTVLDFTRIGAGRIQGLFRPTDLSAFTARRVSQFESTAKRAQLNLIVDAPPLPESVWIDHEMWETIVFNLLSNAMKYTSAGSIRVSLHAEQEQVCLEVRDTGIGIPSAELPRIFERFHRVEGAWARSHEGSGIGLSLVQELVKLHGGSVGVTSVLGEGTAFTVKVPRGSAHLPREQLFPGKPDTSGAGRASPFLQEIEGWLPRSEEKGSARGVPAVTPSPTRILVVDDNADLRMYISGLLQSSFVVETAEDGLEALKAIQQRPPELILSDVMMPRLGGFGLLKHLRADPRLRAIPVILLSARAGEEANVEGLEAGADDYLTKPFSARELVARIGTQLEMARVRREMGFHQAREASLEEAVKARDDFLSVVSHELKTPLAAFGLQLELIERGLSAESRAQLGDRLFITRRQVQRLASLMDTLLDVSQLAVGSLRLRREELDLSALVTEVVARMREELARAQCPVMLEAAPSVRGHFDRVRLEQVVQNLLSNAAKFGPGRAVEVRIQRQDGRALLRVRDHGMGIPPEDRERLWQRFERGVSVHNYGGLGVGLWLTRQVVEAHGGSITMAETPGGGATFMVELPLEG
ncbi:hybrid sensor histidine kinase/response regulator [Hyalangium versicolor]|uniref:hybrid sensor histidine kinase/response regulator n=1 Tax=Hyalangium versicolor TaxID=2861190 RepID=UPI001CCC321B|nr:ATP-binding protein [Hyalangium versicolor]